MTDDERVLVARHSGFQEILLTEDAFGLRSLRFGEGEGRQSVVKVGDPRHLELPYARILPACLAFAREPERMLILGLGGGSLPMFFRSHFPQLTIDVVELDPDVVAVAKKFCGFIEDPRLRVHVADGRDFIESCAGGYDLIILDCFDIDSIPVHLSTREFLGHVRHALSPAGIVVANVWGRGSNSLYAAMVLTYRASFAEVYILDVPGPGTKIFIALPQPLEMTRKTLVARIREIAREREFSYNIGDEISGFRKARAENIKGGAVLTD